jgi:DNA polymerase-4
MDLLEELAPELETLAREVIEYITRKNFRGRTVSLKVKYADFKVITRSKTFLSHIADFDSLYHTGMELLEALDLSPKVRLIGIGIKNIDEEMDWSGGIQLRIKFPDEELEM